MDVLSVFMQGSQNEWKVEPLEQTVYQTGFQTLLTEQQTRKEGTGKSLQDTFDKAGDIEVIPIPSTVISREETFTALPLTDGGKQNEKKDSSPIEEGQLDQLVSRIEALPFEHQLELLAYLKRVIADQLYLFLVDEDQSEQEVMEQMTRLQSLLGASNIESFEKALEALIPMLVEIDSPFTEEVILFEALMTSGSLQVANQALVQLEAVAMDLKFLLSGFLSGDITPKQQAGAYLQLLQAWSKMTANAEGKQAESTLVTKVTEEERAVFEQTFQNYEKRNHFKASNIYQSDAVITKQNIAHWLEQALMRYEQTDQSVVMQPTASFHAIQDEIAQYDIHVNTLQKVEKVNAEMVEQIVRVVKGSKFLSASNLQQISLQLRPENLGNIVVRLTQTDGEMMVKIIVATDAAKKALEANAYQLKQAFSPHQITIEKNELIIKEAFHEKQGGRDNEEQEEDRPKEKEKKDKQEKPVEDFISFLQKLEKGA